MMTALYGYPFQFPLLTVGGNVMWYFLKSFGVSISARQAVAVLDCHE